METINEKETNIDNKIFFNYLIIFSAGLIILSIYYFFQESYDGQHFRQAASYLISGKSPYLSKGFFNPPWVLIPVIPFLIFPYWLADAVLTTINIVCLYAVARHFGAPNWLSFVILVSPIVLNEMRSSNVDGLCLIGLILPPQLGLFFILIKPQIGAIIALFWFIEALRSKGVLKTIKMFMPITFAFILSFFLYGFWPLNATRPISEFWNYSLFPASIPIGLVLFAKAIQSRQLRFAMIASPFLTPYISFPTYMIALLGLLPSTIQTIVAVIGLWIFLLFNDGWLQRHF